MSKIYIETKGCMHNRSNSEAMCALLEKAGHEVFGISKKLSGESFLAQADSIIFNTCTVKNPTEDAFFSRLAQIKTTYPKKTCIVTGCIPQASPDDKRLESAACLGIDQQYNIASFFQDIKVNQLKHDMKRDSTYNRPCKLTQQTNSCIYILPILNGCLGNCTYCKTKHARGQLKSRPIKDILLEVQNALCQNKSEIWLVSEDNGAWGKDNNQNQKRTSSASIAAPLIVPSTVSTPTFPALLEAIATLCKEDQKKKKKKEPCMIRIGMCNPQYVKEFINEFIRLFKKYDCFFQFLHIPLQSGSNEVLKTMNRKYSVEDFFYCCEMLRNEFPSFSISTDIICGFPTEQLADWQKTMEAVKKTKCNTINISKFYPRRKTPASTLSLLKTDIVKSRSRELTTWFDKQNYNKDYENKCVKAVISEIKECKKSYLQNTSIQKSKKNSKHKNKYEEKKSFQAIARTSNYRQVIVLLNDDKQVQCGSWIWCKVLKTTRDDLRAQLICDVQE
ncbi:MAG: MiaB/RimO family radical SAM methylthiotransferase [Candidatus Nanoarchaeia archaeon]